MNYIDQLYEVYDLSGGCAFSATIPITDAKTAIAKSDLFEQFGAAITKEVTYDFITYGPGEEDLVRTDGRRIEINGNTLVFAFQWKEGDNFVVRGKDRFEGPDIKKNWDQVKEILSSEKLHPCSLADVKSGTTIDQHWRLVLKDKVNYFTDSRKFLFLAVNQVYYEVFFRKGNIGSFSNDSNDAFARILKQTQPHVFSV